MQRQTSMKSTALERDVSSDGLWVYMQQILVRYSLVFITIILVLFFSFSTKHFASVLTLRALLGDKSIIALLALAASTTMIVGKIDLNVGFAMTLWHVLPISLQVNYGISWYTAVGIVLVLGLAYGILNGLLVALADIDSFVATLGTGTIIYAISLWHTEGRQIVLQESPAAFESIYFTDIGIFPIIAFYALFLSFLLWLLTSHTPVGRAMYAVGGNPLSALLNGILVNKYIICSFAASGMITAFTGVVLAAKLGVGQSSVGQNFLLPALVGAFLGSTTIKPGRVNIWGTMIAVLLLAVGTTGIQQYG
ncbi:MAG: ABC transporter permease, partial [Spirochaetota bacterium]